MITEKSTLVIGVSNHNEEDPLSNITLCSTYHLHIHLKDLTYPYPQDRLSTYRPSEAMQSHYLLRLNHILGALLLTLNGKTLHPKKEESCDVMS